MPKGQMGGMLTEMADKVQGKESALKEMNQNLGLKMLEIEKLQIKIRLFDQEREKLTKKITTLDKIGRVREQFIQSQQSLIE